MIKFQLCRARRGRIRAYSNNTDVSLSFDADSQVDGPWSSLRKEGCRANRQVRRGNWSPNRGGAANNSRKGLRGFSWKYQMGLLASDLANWPRLSLWLDSAGRLRETFDWGV